MGSSGVIDGSLRPPALSDLTVICVAIDCSCPALDRESRPGIFKPVLFRVQRSTSPDSGCPQSTGKNLFFESQFFKKRSIEKWS